MAVAKLRPDRFLIFVNGGSKRGREKNYSRFREWAQHCFEVPLPRSIGDSFIVYFADDWHPQLLDSSRVTNEDTRVFDLDALQGMIEGFGKKKRGRRGGNSEDG